MISDELRDYTQGEIDRAEAHLLSLRERGVQVPEVVAIYEDFLREMRAILDEDDGQQAPTEGER